MPMRTSIAITSALFGFLGVLPMANASGTGSPAAAVQVDKLFATWNTADSPGCAVAVMKDGHVAYERGYGMADLDHPVRITPETVFNVGSIAKQFTAAAILMLAQDGKLALDDSVRKFLPEVPDFCVSITLRQMLSHTSGIRDYESLLRFDGWRLDSPDLLTDGDILYILSRQKELNFQPGSDFAYSNTNYMLLAQVVSRVSGESFPNFTRTRLFQPLRMTHTEFRTDHAQVVPNLAYSYIEEGGVLRLWLPNYDTFGATNLLTTAEDLARWEQNFQTARVGGVRLLVQLQQPGRLKDGTRLNYAPGMFIGITPGGLKWVQSGTAGDAGYRADIIRFPDRNLSVVTLCNLGSINPTEINNRVGDIYLEGSLTATLQSSLGPRTSQLEPKNLATYAGTYADASDDYVLKLEGRDNALWAQSYTGPSAIGPAKLEAIGEGQFRGLGMKELDFSSDARFLTVLREGLPSIRYTRSRPYKPTVQDLRAFAGQFVSAEWDIPYYVELRGSELVLRALKLPGQTLAPIAENLFIGGDMRVRFTRDLQGKVRGFLLSGYWNRVQNLSFERAAG